MSEPVIRQLTVAIPFEEQEFTFWCLGEVREFSGAQAFELQAAITKQSLETVPNAKWYEFKETLRASLNDRLGIVVQPIRPTVIDVDPMLVLW